MKTPIISTGKQIKGWIRAKANKPKIQLPLHGLFQDTPMKLIEDNTHYLILNLDKSLVRLREVEIKESLI